LQSLRTSAEPDTHNKTISTFNVLRNIYFIMFTINYLV
jgi:hypothetical protein